MKLCIGVFDGHVALKLGGGRRFPRLLHVKVASHDNQVSEPLIDGFLAAFPAMVHELNTVLICCVVPSLSSSGVYIQNHDTEIAVHEQGS